MQNLIQSIKKFNKKKYENSGGGGGFVFFTFFFFFLSFCMAFSLFSPSFPLPPSFLLFFFFL
ncbi:hypothetical protein AW246_08500 [Campylobacter jejuni]|nr:hypothetical protein AW246_08500 [Campylobacter jejuni]